MLHGPGGQALGFKFGIQGVAYLGHLRFRACAVWYAGDLGHLRLRLEDVGCTTCPGH